MSIQEAIKKITQGEHLSFEEAEAVMEIIMSGDATPAQVGAYLMGLRMKGETIAEIGGSAKAMRAMSNKPLVKTPKVVDTCGTGGDGANTFNISTTVAFVVAGAGVSVAKHGNRSVSSKSGSADVLKELGVNLDLTPEQAGRCVDEVGIGFLFAPVFHPAMKHAIGPRREMGIRTIFNILGPLTNPAGASYQLMGVFSKDLTEPLAYVLRDLGSEAACVVHGAGGLDELTTTGINTISELRAGEVKTYELNPRNLGLQPATVEDLKGGDPAENAHITRQILSGQGTVPQREVTALNAAAALMVSGKSANLEHGLELANQALESGAGLAKLEALIAFSQGITA